MDGRYDYYRPGAIGGCVAFLSLSLLLSLPAFAFAELPAIIVFSALHRYVSQPLDSPLYVGLIHLIGLSLSLNGLLANGYCACLRVYVWCLASSCLVVSCSPHRQTAVLGLLLHNTSIIASAASHGMNNKSQ